MGISYTSEMLREDIGDNPYGYINAYDVTLGYGGPEEGGWWFSCYQPIASVRVINTEEAIAALDMLEGLFVEQYEEAPGRSSMASNAGDLVIRLETKFAEFEPTTKPTYS